MADGDKPYRVYRGGRVKGRVPVVAKQAPSPPSDADDRPRIPGTAPAKRRWTWRRGVVVGLLAFLFLLVAWTIASYAVFASGVSAARDRAPASARAALTKQNGLLLSHPSTILLLGTDHSDLASRAALEHSDSIMLVRTDPGKHRIAYLSIPRDLRVEIPGHGTDRINAAFQIGGPGLAARTVESFTGLPINHIVIVDFAKFEQLIDALGGVTVDVPQPILSNRFDCPFATSAQCGKWQGWRFAKGKQHMDGHRALVYSRIRENRLNPADSDVSRGERQQQVLQAITGKLTSFGTFLKLPFIGDSLVKPLATDLSAWQLTQLAWVKFRAPSGRALHCRLGGSPSTVGGASVIVGTEENVAVIQMLTGRSAPQPPVPGSGLYGPGCVVGSKPLGAG